MKNILLTGGGGGIAKAIAPLLPADSYRLLLTTRAGDALASFCKEHSIQAEVFSADLTVQEEVEALFEWTNSFGGVDILINNAGVSHAAASWKLTAEELHRLMEVNFYSAVRCTQLALEGMRGKGYGRIISISSVVAHKPAFGPVPIRLRKVRLKVTCAVFPWMFPLKGLQRIPLRMAI
jgi:NAD(P)-dependent dehydrogenase (short-subunit alcohol dehydrogenase family)